MEDSKPDNLLIIDNLETLRVLTDPLRNQIYELLISVPLNVRQIAERLGVVPSRLYYHMSLLEKHGLVRVVETRMVANMVEKIYRASAYEIELAPNLLRFSTGEERETITEILTANLDVTREDLLRSINSRLFDVEEGQTPHMPRPVLVSRTTARISEVYANEFRERLSELIASFSAQDGPHRQPDEDDQNFAFMVAFYPSFYFGEKEPPAEAP